MNTKHASNHKQDTCRGVPLLAPCTKKKHAMISLLLPDDSSPKKHPRHAMPSLLERHVAGTDILLLRESGRSVAMMCARSWRHRLLNVGCSNFSPAPLYESCQSTHKDIAIRRSGSSKQQHTRTRWVRERCATEPLWRDSP